MSLNSRPLARHRAQRAIAEGARGTLDLVADATGRSLRSLKKQAEREGWALDRAPRTDVPARLRKISAGLLDQVEAMSQEAAASGGRIDKTRIDGILATVRGIDKIGEIMRPEEAAKENQNRCDEDLANVLERINTRIVELAEELARRMLAGDIPLDEAPGRPRRGGPRQS